MKLDRERLHFIPVVFVFTMLYSINLGGIDTRYFVLIFWTIFCLCKRIGKFSKTLLYLPICLIFLSLYSLFIMMINNSNNSFECLRIIRSAITFFVIYMFISTEKYSKNEIYKAIEISLLLHALCVIAGIILPSIKEILLPISQYNKQFYSLRSTGLVSGFDNAGYLCNCGLFLRYNENQIRNKKVKFDFTALLFAIAAIFTGRVGMLVMLVIVVFIFFKEMKTPSLNGKLLILVVAILGILGVMLLWILTTNIGISFRSRLIKAYPQLERMYNLLMSSYTDYGKYTNAVIRHWHPDDISIFGFIFGKGVRPENSDIGYIKTIFSVGLVGVITEMYIFIKSIGLLKRKCNSVIFEDRKIYKRRLFGYSFVVFLMFVMELKMSFILASTTTELIYILFINEMYEGRKNENSTFRIRT